MIVKEVKSRDEISNILNNGKSGVVYGFLYKGVNLKVGYKPGIGTMMYQIKHGEREENCEHGCTLDDALNIVEELSDKQ